MSLTGSGRSGPGGKLCFYGSKGIGKGLTCWALSTGPFSTLLASHCSSHERERHVHHFGRRVPCCLLLGQVDAKSNTRLLLPLSSVRTEQLPRCYHRLESHHVSVDSPWRRRTRLASLCLTAKTSLRPRTRHLPKEQNLSYPKARRVLTLALLSLRLLFHMTRPTTRHNLRKLCTTPQRIMLRTI